MMNSQKRVTDFSGQRISAHYGPSGQANVIRAVHPQGITEVVRGPHGLHTISTTLPGGGRVMNYGQHSGYVQRPIPGRDGYVSRTVVHGSSSHAEVYQSYTYNQETYYRYVPPVSYQPAFYGWMSRPWGVSVTYSWGAPAWGTAYGAYFTPYPSYPTANLWLTDYVLNANLQAAYDERQAAVADPAYYSSDNSPVSLQGQAPDQMTQASSPPAQLSPEVKALIAKEIGSYMSEMQSATTTTTPSSNPSTSVNTVPDALQPSLKAFEISTDMQLEVSENQSCALTPGDVLLRKSTTPDQNNRLPVVVVGTKSGDCDMNTTATITVAALNEISQEFEQQLQPAIQTLVAKQGGKGPFPQGPAPNPSTVELASVAPDAGADAMLQQNQQNGQLAETELASATGAPH